MRYLFLIATLLFSTLAFAENKPEYAVANIPPELLPNARAVIRYASTDFDVKSVKSATETVRFVVTRFSEEAGYSSLVVPYDEYSKVGKIRAWLYDAEGNEIRKIDKEEVLDYSAVSGFSIYEDDRVKYIDLSYGQYPYTIEYEYDVSYKQIMSYPIWQVQRFHTAVEESTYTIRLPQGMTYHSKVFQLDVEPSQTVVDGMQVDTWRATNVKAVEREPMLAQAENVLAKVLIAPAQFEVENYTGSMSSWEAFGEFMYRLNADRDALSPAMQKQVHALTEGLNTDMEKIEVLYRFLQENMRYVSVQLGIGGWQTFDAEYVETNKYGDCKALTNFMKAMLKAAGIEAYAALIRNGGTPHVLTEDFALPSFNHVILHIPSEEMWLECTSSNFPPNYIGASNADRPVLLVTEKGGQLARTPERNPQQNLQESSTNIRLQADGQAVLEDKVRLTGAMHDIYRSASNQLSEEEMRKWFLENSSLPMCTIEKLEVSAAKEEPAAQLNYELKMLRFASRAGRRLFAPINVVNAFTSVPPAVEERNFPARITKARMEVDTVIINLPKDMQVESIPEETMAIESDFGTYQAAITQEGQQVIYTRKFVIRAVEIAPKRYEELRTFFKQVAKADAVKMVLVEKRT